jgi:hypothetical protein
VTRRLADVEVGAELPEQTSRVTRADLVRYAGASGDFNVVVPDDDAGAELTVRGRVAAVGEDGRVRIDLTVTSNGEKVLSLARAFVVLG